MYKQNIFKISIGTFAFLAVCLFALPANSHANTVVNIPSITTVVASAKSSHTKSSAQPAVTGMKQYTDKDFGFSFWYPSAWTVQNSDTDEDVRDTYDEGSITKTLQIIPAVGSDNAIAIEEFVSAGKSIKDSSICGPAGGCPSAVRYYFNSRTHTWMKDSYFEYGSDNPEYSPKQTKAADVSVNSMGGLHMLRGNARFSDNLIIPLSAKKFLIVHNVNAGSGNIQPLANTVLALDPLVATPVSVSRQTEVIRAEGVGYTALSTRDH